MYEIWTYGVSATREQGLLRGLGRRRARIRRQDRPLEGLQRSRRRDRDRPVQGPGADSRDHHFRQLCREGQDPVGRDLLRREPLRRPELAQLSAEGQRAAEQFPEPGEGRGRIARLVLHRQGPGLFRWRELGGIPHVAGNPQAGNRGARRRGSDHADRKRQRRRPTITCSAWISRETISGWRRPTA